MLAKIRCFLTMHHLPNYLACLVFGGFFYAFFALTASRQPAYTTALASMLPYQIVTNRLVSHPSQTAYEHMFVPRLLFENPYTQVKNLGDEFAQRLTLPGYQPVAYALDPSFNALINQLVADGFDRARMVELFSALGLEGFSPQFMSAKVAELHGVGAMGVTPRFQPGQFTPAGYVAPLSSVTYGECLAFIQENAANFEAIAERYGVPPQVILGILLVETGFGTNLGGDVALRALGSMAATDSITMLNSKGTGRQSRAISTPILERTLRAKSAWAYNEVAALISFGEKNGLNVAQIPGSMYGAIGLCQFMPSNLELFGVDGDGDGKINLFTPVDAIYSVANYLSQNGWSAKGGRDHQLRVIYTYNHDYSYANNVLNVAKQISLAEKGKVALARNPLGVVSSSGRGYADRYLAKRGRGGVRVTGMGSYSDLLGN